MTDIVFSEIFNLADKLSIKYGTKCFSEINMTVSPEFFYYLLCEFYGTDSNQKFTKMTDRISLHHHAMTVTIHPTLVNKENK